MIVNAFFPSDASARHVLLNAERLSRGLEDDSSNQNPFFRAWFRLFFFQTMVYNPSSTSSSLIA